MTREALDQYDTAHSEQLLANEARHILTKVSEARQAPLDAGKRWPFELLQNAIDAGPRTGNDDVSISLSYDENTAVFCHNGQPFSSKELAALLSGGSSKAFDAEETTGRFGTGFLVTHVLAERTSLSGILHIQGEFEYFSLHLDRGGDERAILDNIKSAKEAIGDARQLASIDDYPSARFEYPVEDDDTFRTGIEAFRSALPYLYGTRPLLGVVHLVEGLETEVWKPQSAIETPVPNGHLVERPVRVERKGGPISYRVAQFFELGSSRASALLLLRWSEGSWHVVTPGPTDPRIYYHYPLRASTFLPIEFILDGPLSPDQERNRAFMHDEDDRQVVSEALRGAVAGTEQACREGWINYHLLARAAPPTSWFDPQDREEGEWWALELRSFGEKLARLPIVETSDGLLPALNGEGRCATFAAPTLFEGSSGTETTIDRMWSLLDQMVDVSPPVRRLAANWCETAAAWADLGLDVTLLTVERVGNKLRTGTTDIADLKVEGDPYIWLSLFVDIVGECWEERSGVDTTVLRSLLPNQHGELCSPDQLRRDTGVPEDLKDLLQTLGRDVRQGLLATDLGACIADLRLNYGHAALKQAIPVAVDEEGIAQELLDHLKSLFPDEADCSTVSTTVQGAARDFLAYLWTTRGEAGQHLARQTPLVTRGDNVVYWGPKRTMMAPVSSWPGAAQPFSAAYPEDRILSDLYTDRHASLVSALEAWNIAIADPLTRASPEEVGGARLAGLVPEGSIVRV